MKDEMKNTSDEAYSVLFKYIINNYVDGVCFIGKIETLCSKVCRNSKIFTFIHGDVNH